MEKEESHLFMAVLLAWARAQPVAMGAKKCNRRGVGPILRELRTEAADNGIALYSGAQHQAAQILASHCRLCGVCQMSK